MKMFSNLYVFFQRKLGNKSHNLSYCSSLQPRVVYNFSEIEITFLASFLTLRWWLRGMVYIYLIRNSKHYWFLLRRTSPWLVYFSSTSVAICLLLKIFCQGSKFSMSNVLNDNESLMFFSILHQFIRKRFRIFVTVMRSKFNFLLKFSTRGT